MDSTARPRARWADGSPAEGALVSVSDRTGREAAREELRAGGRLGGLVLREASIGLKEAFNFTPHEVNCSFGSVYNRTVQNMDRSRFLDIVSLTGAQAGIVTDGVHT